MNEIEKLKAQVSRMKGTRFLDVKRGVNVKLSNDPQVMQRFMDYLYARNAVCTVARRKRKRGS